MLGEKKQNKKKVPQIQNIKIIEAFSNHEINFDSKNLIPTKKTIQIKPVADGCKLCQISDSFYTISGGLQQL